MHYYDRSPTELMLTGPPRPLPSLYFSLPPCLRGVLLVSFLQDAETRNTGNNTPLHFACLNGHVEVSF